MSRLYNAKKYVDPRHTEEKSPSLAMAVRPNMSRTKIAQHFTKEHQLVNFLKLDPAQS